MTWTMRRCLDGTFAAGGATITEDSTNGWYKVALTQADTNGNDIGYNFTGTGAVPQTVNVITTACDPTTATNFGITALPATAVTTNASLLTSGTGTDQLKVSSGNATVNVVQVNGSAAVGQAGYVSADWGNTTGKTGTVSLTNTTIATVTTATNLTTNNDKTGYALTTGERTSVADAILDRDMSVGTDSGSATVRTPRQALRALRNKVDASSGSLSVYKEDDSTASWTATLTGNASAAPIVTVDPAGP